MGNFQAKSDKGIFFGYSLNSCAYRIYNLGTKIIMESINVVVDDLNDIARISSDDEAIRLTDEAKNKLQNCTIAPSIAIEGTKK